MKSCHDIEGELAEWLAACHIWWVLDQKLDTVTPERPATAHTYLQPQFGQRDSRCRTATRIR